MNNLSGSGVYNLVVTFTVAVGQKEGGYNVWHR